MKKIVLLLGVWLLLAGCQKQEAPQANQQPTDQTSLTTNETGMCASVIKTYLEKADKKWSWAEVKKWHNITVHYIGRLNDQDVFDTSVEEIAKACGKYTAGRNYNEGLAFEVGAGQMIAGFDKAVEGMKIGQTKTISIPAKEAYGEWSEKNIITVPMDQLPKQEYIKGMKLSTSYWQVLTVYEVLSTGVVLDGNHELAGKDLIFDITIVSIK